MRADPRARLVAQLMRQPLGVGLQRRLGDVVGEIAGRRGDALLGAGVDDQARRALRQHPRRECLRRRRPRPRNSRRSARFQASRFSHGLPGLLPTPALFMRNETSPNFSYAASASFSSVVRPATRRRRQPSTSPSPPAAIAARSRIAGRAPAPSRSAITIFMPRAGERLGGGEPDAARAPVMTAVRPLARAGMLVVLGVMSDSSMLSRAL